MNARSQATSIRGGKISNCKEKRFPHWKRGRHAVVYMKEVLIVALGFFQLFYYV